MYKERFNSIIDKDSFYKQSIDRASQAVSDILNKDFVIDVHMHIFDIKCINKSYFIIRLLKDFIGLKGTDESFVDYDVETLYNNNSQYIEGWEEELEKELLMRQESGEVHLDGKKGIIDLIKARKFLGFKFMNDVYEHYIENFSLAKYFNLPKRNVISTALMMDLEMGWGVKTKKSFYDQVLELKELSKVKPILPFLYCDPRRADLTGKKDNLYELFNLAFKGNSSFFGVKIYPALGYDPSDYRLWPIYELCEELNIPVLTHCGGESVSTDILDLDIYEGEKKVRITAKKRREIAYILNNPNRWRLVLEKFPNLRLNFAHFGGYETWSSSSPANTDIDPQRRKETIFDFMNDYPNVYADFSYNLIEVNLSNNLKNVLYFKDHIRSRTLFGTDYWVVNKAGNLMKSQNDFLKNMDERTEGLNLSKVLCITNTMNYLFTKEEVLRILKKK